MEKKQIFCGICSTGCPMDVYVEDGKVVSVEGRVEDGKSRGLCSKGARQSSTFIMRSGSCIR